MLAKFTIRSFAFGAVAAILILGGFGCKGLTQEQVQSTQPITLEYWTTFDDVDALQKLIAEYKVLRPYLTINVRQLGQDEMYPRLVDALAEDQGPDIVSINNRMIGQYASKIAPMPESVKDTTITVQKGTVSTQTIVNTVTIPLPNATQIASEYVQAVKNDVVRNGSVYGLPLSLDTLAIYYNKDVLDKAGVAEPPKSWEEFQAAVKKITKYDAKTGKIIQAGAALGSGSNVPGNDDILYALFKQSNVSFVDKSTGRAVFEQLPQNYDRSSDSPAMTVVNFYTDFANSSRDTYTWNETMPNALDAFVNGSLGFFFGYRYHYPIIKARAPQLNFAIIPLLQLIPDNPVNVANYSIDAVLSKSKHQNEAWAFVQYLTHSAATKEYLALSARPTALRAYINEERKDPDMAPFASSLLVAENWYHGRDYNAAKRAISDLTHEWLLIAPDTDKVLQQKNEVLQRAAAKINQTF